MSYSNFLFDNRDYLTHGEIFPPENANEAAVLMKVTREKKKKTLAFKQFTTVLVSIGMVILGLSSVTPLVFPKMKYRQATTYEDSGTNEGLAKEFLRAKKYLGLKQNDIMLITGISISTIEKIDQGIYPNVGDQVSEQLEPVIELYQILKSHFGDKKFIARAHLNTPDSLLGDITALDFARKHGQEGLQEVIGLKYKILG